MFAIVFIFVAAIQFFNYKFHLRELLLNTYWPPTNTSHSPSKPSTKPSTKNPRTFSTSFESLKDFSGFYIAPQNHMGTASHDQSTERVMSGTYSHKGWIWGSNPKSTLFQNNNHRGYPTIQLYKTPSGAFRTPALIEFWVWLDADLKEKEWFSFATLDHTTSNTWDAVLVNLSDKGIVHLMHVPLNNQGKTVFQAKDIIFPFRTWVKLTICLHFDATRGYAKVWQDDQLVSEAKIGRGDGFFTQAHFGLYAPPSVSRTVIYNDDLTIQEGSCDK